MKWIALIIILLCASNMNAMTADSVYTPFARIVFMGPAHDSTMQFSVECVSIMDTLGADIPNVMYKIQVWDDTPNIREIYSMRKTNMRMEGLKKDTRYYWRIRAINSANASDWSDIKWFETRK